MSMVEFILPITYPITEMALVALILRKAEATLMLIPSFQDRVQACGLETGT